MYFTETYLREYKETLIKERAYLWRRHYEIEKEKSENQTAKPK